MSTIGAYRWSTARVSPDSGELALVDDPVAGYANTLRASDLDDRGNDRSAELAAVVEGDTIEVRAQGGAPFRSVVTGPPVDGGTYWEFPFVVRSSFAEGDEPGDGEDVTLATTQAATAVPALGWPTTAELAQVLDVENVADWQRTLDRVLAAAIDATKGAVGDWDDAADAPDENLAAAALRMAELMSQRPDATVRSLTADASFRAYMTGKHRRFGFA